MVDLDPKHHLFTEIGLPDPVPTPPRVPFQSLAPFQPGEAVVDRLAPDERERLSMIIPDFRLLRRGLSGRQSDYSLMGQTQRVLNIVAAIEQAWPHLEDLRGLHSVGVHDFVGAIIGEFDQSLPFLLRTRRITRDQFIQSRRGSR